MVKETTISEFRSKILSRLLCEKLVKNQVNNYDLLVLNAIFCANEILHELGIIDVSVRKRNKRAFMFHKPTKRIICELGVSTEPNLHNPEVWVINLRGVVPDSRTLEGIIADVAKLGRRQPRERTDNGNH